MWNLSKLSLGKIAKKIGKTTECVSREIRANRTIAPGEHFFGKDCHYAGSAKPKDYAERMDAQGGV